MSNPHEILAVIAVFLIVWPTFNGWLGSSMLARGAKDVLHLTSFFDIHGGTVAVVFAMILGAIMLLPAPAMLLFYGLLCIALFMYAGAFWIVNRWWVMDAKNPQFPVYIFVLLCSLVMSVVWTIVGLTIAAAQGILAIPERMARAS